MFRLKKGRGKSAAFTGAGLAASLLVVSLAAFGARGESAAERLSSAPWVCPVELTNAVNVTTEFKIPFSAAAAGKGTLVFAADGFYAIELNGKTVIEHAHLPDTPPRRYFDTITLEDVRAGANELTVRLYIVGIDTFQVMAAKPGFAFSLKAPGVDMTSAAPMRWRVSRKDISKGVGLMTFQFGWTFEHDASVPEEQWRKVGASDRAPGGCSFEARPTEPAVTAAAIPWRIVDQGSLGVPASGADVRGLMDATPMRTVPEGAFYRDGSVNPEYFKTGFYFIVDLGREEAGLLDVAFDTDAGVIVDIGHGEHMSSGRVMTRFYNYSFVGRVRAAEGSTQFVRWQRRMAGRYLQLHVRGVKTKFALRRATVRPVMRKLVEKRVPEYLNPRRRLIWTTAVRTLHLCMHEHYEDSPWREQALYANDARNQILCGKYAFENDGAFAAMSLELLSRGLDEDGWLAMCMPARIDFTIPSFTFSWNLAVRDHWELYRDRAFLEKMAPTMKAVLDRRLSELTEGLLPAPNGGSRYWPFYDWAPGLDGGMRLKAGVRRFDAPLNMLLLQALEANAPLMEVLGDKECAARWRDAAAKLRKEIVAGFWNEDQGRFDTYKGEVDWGQIRMKRGDGHELVQALALLTECVPEEFERELAEKLAGNSDWIETTLSQSLHKYEALIKAGPEFGRKAMAHMDAQWGKMLDAGATSFWEMKDGWKDFSGAGSLCHGWSAVPVYFYARYPEFFKKQE